MRIPGMVSLSIIGLLTVAGCRQQGDSRQAKTVPPAKVARPGNEQELNTITLTEQAEQRLGIRTLAVKLVEVQQRRTLGGEVVIPPGQTIVVSAPVTGTLSTPETDVPVVGSHLEMGRAVFHLRPFLTPERDVLTPAERVRIAQTRADVATAKLEAEREVASAKVQVAAATIAHERAIQLLQDKAGSQRSVDEAGAQLELAEEALATAEARHRLLAPITLDEEAGELVSRTIASPVSGVLQRVDVAPGETVTAGTPLFHVVRLDRVWIRVPVYVGQWRDIDPLADAQVCEYGQAPDAPPRPAQPVQAPPSADADAATVDVFYEMDNADGRLYPQQKLAVTLSMGVRQPTLVAPWSAVLYDVLGGAWVYEQVAPRTYARRRVQVKYVDRDDAILVAGPKPGAKVVTDGAAELFGTEFGAGK